MFIQTFFFLSEKHTQKVPTVFACFTLSLSTLSLSILPTISFSLYLSLYISPLLLFLSKSLFLSHSISFSLSSVFILPLSLSRLHFLTALFVLKKSPRTFCSNNEHGVREYLAGLINYERVQSISSFVPGPLSRALGSTRAQCTVVEFTKRNFPRRL